MKKGPQCVKRDSMRRKCFGFFSPRSQMKPDNKVIIMCGNRRMCKLLTRARLRLLVISRAVWRERNSPSDWSEYQFHTSGTNILSRKLLLCCHQPRQKFSPVSMFLIQPSFTRPHQPLPPTPSPPAHSRNGIIKTIHAK